MEYSLVIKIITALFLGAAVGFERESHEHHTNKAKRVSRGSLGVRSYTLISLLGVLSGLTYIQHLPLFVLTMATFALLLLSYYLLSSFMYRDIGLTTELAILLNFLFGVFLGSNFIAPQLIIALTVVLILIMSLKAEIKNIVAKIRANEIDAFISYALIALVVLPFLPDKSITLASAPGVAGFLKSLKIGGGELFNIEIVNPFNLWRIVVIITGTDIAGYLLEKTVGQKKSWLLTSIAGGFISSTSTTQSIAIRSKSSKNINGLVAAAVFANVSSFFQHLILIASINAVLLTTGLPYLLAIILSGSVAGHFFYSSSKKNPRDEMKETRNKIDAIKIFSLKPALQFALLFTIIKLFSKISLVYFGRQGFFLATGIAAFTGLDAVTLSVGEIAGKSISLKTGVMALIFANAINLSAKTFYSFVQGSRAFALKFGIACGAIIVSSLVSLFYL